MVKNFPNKEGLLTAILSGFCYVLMFRNTVYTSLDLMLFLVGFLGLFFITFLVISYVACMDSLEVMENGIDS